MRFFDNIWRQNYVEKLVKSGLIEGKIAYGRQGWTYLNSLTQAIGDIKINSDKHIHFTWNADRGL